MKLNSTLCWEFIFCNFHTLLSRHMPEWTFFPNILKYQQISFKYFSFEIFKFKKRIPLELQIPDIQNLIFIKFKSNKCRHVLFRRKALFTLIVLNELTSILFLEELVVNLDFLKGDYYSSSRPAEYRYLTIC